MDNQVNQSNGKATASLVLGIISLIVLIIGFAFPGASHFVGVVLSIIGLVLGIQAKKEDPENGQAKAGVVINIVGLILNALVFISCALCFGSLACMGDDVMRIYSYRISYCYFPLLLLIYDIIIGGQNCSQQ